MNSRRNVIFGAFCPSEESTALLPNGVLIDLVALGHWPKQICFRGVLWSGKWLHRVWFSGWIERQVLFSHPSVYWIKGAESMTSLILHLYYICTNACSYWCKLAHQHPNRKRQRGQCQLWRSVLSPSYRPIRTAGEKHIRQKMVGAHYRHRWIVVIICKSRLIRSSYTGAVRK